MIILNPAALQLFACEHRCFTRGVARGVNWVQNADKFMFRCSITRNGNFSKFWNKICKNIGEITDKP